MRSLLSPALRAGFLVLLLLALLTIGCGSKTGTLSGKVTYQGKALTGGFVTFISEGPEAKTLSCGIQKDGSYSLSGVPVGPVKITVQGVADRTFKVPKAMENVPGVAEAKSDQPVVNVPLQYSQDRFATHRSTRLANARHRAEVRSEKKGRRGSRASPTEGASQEPLPFLSST
jgi:hypothetical protein